MGHKPLTIAEIDVNAVYGVIDIAGALGVSERTVRTLCYTQSIEHFKVGQQIRITGQALTDYINKNTVKAKEQKQ